MPVYNALIAKGGLKMTLSENQTKPNPIAGVLDNQVRATFQQFGAEFKVTLRSASLTSIVGLLQNQADGPIVDKTGLTGLYDAQLEVDSDRSRALYSLQEQLGLKLESARGMVEVLVVDAVTRPTEN